MKEIVRYAICTEFGDILRICPTEEVAKTEIDYRHRLMIVKMVGQMPELKKPRLLAPAIYKAVGKIWISNKIYGGEEAAREDLGSSFISWPAVANEGFYEVPE
jgi:hypothetical protein